jgi:hypothetical protein
VPLPSKITNIILFKTMPLWIIWENTFDYTNKKWVFPNFYFFVFLFLFY